MASVYQFQFSRHAKADFAALDNAVKKRIIKKLEFYEDNKNPLLFGKKLQGFDYKFSFRVGDYRIIVTPKNQHTLVILLILKIGHRREVYE